MQVKKSRTQHERSERTRRALLTAARSLFVQKGYAATSTPEIVTRAGVTRGALYHQFADKQALFAAVVEQEAKAVADAIEVAAPHDLAPMEALLAGAVAYLDAMQLEGRTRLLLIDGPAVLGLDAMRAIEAEHGNRTLLEGLQGAMAAGAVQPLPLAALTELLAAMFDRAALTVDTYSAQAHRDVMKAILQGLAPQL